MNKILPCFFNIILILISILLTLIVIEIALALLDIRGIERYVYNRKVPIVQYIYGRYHPLIKYVLKPELKEVKLSYGVHLDYSVSTNSKGFRGEEWDLSNKRKNIVVLGDSYAFGWGVSWKDTFSELVEENLRLEDDSFQVINLAQSGYFLDQIVNTFDLYGEKFDFAGVVYLFCYNDPLEHPKEVNDSFDINNYRKDFTEDDFLKESKRNNVNYWRFDRFYQGLRTFAFYKNYLLPFVAQNKPKIVNASWRQRFEYTYKDLPAPVFPSEVKRDTVKRKYIWYCLNKLNNLAKGKPFVMMDTSNKMVIHMPDSSRSDRWILRDFASQHDNVFFLDVESRIRNLNDGKPRFFDIDEHWNEDGHLLAAELLTELILHKLVSVK